MIHEEYRKFVRNFGATMSLREYFDAFWRRRELKSIKIPKAMEAEFANPENEDEWKIKALIDEWNADEAARLEQELFKQRKRLADAERTLASKPTKAATESKRIATNKVEWTLAKLGDLRRTELKGRDYRIYPGYYAPVLMSENGKLVVKPMRYQCRPQGKPAFYDKKYPGTYNARRDNLEGFWKGLFGYTHGVLVISAFYENVDRHRVEGRELRAGEKPENVILEFKPKPRTAMFAACLYSHWTRNGEPDLLSFAAITDEPPAEIAAAGHDRCIIPIKQEHIAAWLNPNPKDLKDSYRILDDRQRPYYEHRMAA